MFGSYPGGKSYDMNYGKAEEAECAKKNIAKVPLPKEYPAFGEGGIMFDFWK